MHTKIYPASEVAFTLRLALGPLRAWDDCLTDMRRGATRVDGHVLLPVGRIHDGRAWRPGYSADDIAKFITAVQATSSEACRRAPLKFKIMDINPKDARHWRARKFIEGVAETRSSRVTYQYSKLAS